jgi:ABC-2 type transport system ATP-binding protein
VLLTTHYLDEAQQLADRVGVIAKGRLIAEGTPDELIARAGATVVRFEVPATATASELGSALPPGASLAGGHVEFTSDHPTRDVHAVTAWATERGIELGGLTVERPTLEDVFLAMTADDEPTA